MLFGHLDLGLSRGGGCSLLWGLYVVGCAFHFVCFGFGVSVWAAETAGKSSEEVGVTLATGRKNSGRDPLQPHVREAELSPCVPEAGVQEMLVSERYCRISSYFGGQMRRFWISLDSSKITMFRNPIFAGV